jgi:hypothetical protein
VNAQGLHAGTIVEAACNLSTTRAGLLCEVVLQDHSVLAGNANPLKAARQTAQRRGGVYAHLVADSMVTRWVEFVSLTCVPQLIALLLTFRTSADRYPPPLQEALAEL